MSLSLVVAIVALLALAYNIVDAAFGYVLTENVIEPTEVVEFVLTDVRNDTTTDPATVDLATLGASELAAVLREYQEPRLRVYIRDFLSVVPDDEFTQAPIRESLAGSSFRGQFADLTINDLDAAEWTLILGNNIPQDRLVGLVRTEVIGERILETWSLTESVTGFAEIDEARVAAVEGQNPNARLEFRSWLNINFLISPMSTNPAIAGIRTALLGTLWVMIITVGFSFPLGVGAALYLQEYADDNWLTRVISTNIRNLAGVPSIIYGLLGLSVFVIALEGITTGRSILSASLTLGLLILPVMIVNSQEALRAVPPSVREGSYGLGATRWQTIWRSVLPAAMPGILTGTILGMSRAIGETAPLLALGASTFLVVDPSGPFSRFTVLPIQIYQWTSRPSDQWRSLASAAIIVLIILLLSLNAAAIYMRQRFRRKLQP
ncbi:MAG: phosphate ABC transporter permease PstA [Chloroflexi bacterium]|nr:phosphate ABC transporter permease PstA [Chloroflexota bacterium]